jgi:hypothetical protein
MGHRGGNAAGERFDERETGGDSFTLPGDEWGTLHGSDLLSAENAFCDPQASRA